MPVVAIRDRAGGALHASEGAGTPAIRWPAGRICEVQSDTSRLAGAGGTRCRTPRRRAAPTRRTATRRRARAPAGCAAKLSRGAVGCYDRRLAPAAHEEKGEREDARIGREADAGRPASRRRYRSRDRGRLRDRTGRGRTIRRRRRQRGRQRHRPGGRVPRSPRSFARATATAVRSGSGATSPPRASTGRWSTARSRPTASSTRSSPTPG